jgi:hypothetical protein
MPLEEQLQRDLQQMTRYYKNYTELKTNIKQSEHNSYINIIHHIHSAKKRSLNIQRSS